MDNFLNKIFFRTQNLDYISQNLKDITKQTSTNKIFEAINTFSKNSFQCQSDTFVLQPFVTTNASFTRPFNSYRMDPIFDEKRQKKHQTIHVLKIPCIKNPMY